nr:immunoglobulin light chain junction region [Macaca mulatta]MOX28611.1 immunoglobulin light chain junction region [Macaca mulatta]MOX28768.1 immunoglobulin light chain junction region [Macaca mulatta]MOX28858.1 immunoglobulin light chain junction region [Macaca mulatta]MOX29973.1 immunoglobulin light chain junction region [Macaca mulatta]
DYYCCSYTPNSILLF